MHDHPKDARGVQDAYSQYNSPPHENEGIAGTSGVQDKPDAGNPGSGDDDDDDTQVNSDLLNIWTTRLQVLTAVTTFLTSMDGEMFSLTTLNTQIGVPVSPAYRQIIYSCLAGALILHICASILGFIASFALTRYRIAEDSTKVRVAQYSGLDATQPAQRVSRRVILEPVLPTRWFTNFLQRTDRFQFLSTFRSSRSSVPSPLSTLMHCYYTTLAFTAAGFVLALTGILTYVWAGLPMPVGIFSTVCVGVAFSAIVWAVAL